MMILSHKSELNLDAIPTCLSTPSMTKAGSVPNGRTGVISPTHIAGDTGFAESATGDKAARPRFYRVHTVRQLPVLVDQCALSTMGTVELMQRAHEPHVRSGRA